MLNQAQIAAQQMRRRTDQNKLDELEFTQGQFDDERDRLNASPHPGAPYSGYSNEHEYREGLNRQGQIAGLRSRKAGRGGLNVSHTYAGTDFARRPALSALHGAAIGRTPVAPNEVSDNSDYYLRQNAIRAGQLEVNAMEDAQNERDLSDNPYRVEQRGNIARDELRRNARASGEAAADQSNANYFGTEGVRHDQRFEERSQARERGYYDPRIAAADIEARGRVAASANDKQRERSAALKAYADLIKNQAQTPKTLTRKVPGSGVLGTDWLAETEEVPNPSWDSFQQGIDDSRQVIGLDDPEGGGGPGGQTLSQEDLQAFAEENGMTVDEVAKLAQQYGYAIR